MDCWGRSVSVSQSVSQPASQPRKRGIVHAQRLFFEVEDRLQRRVEKRPGGWAAPPEPIASAASQQRATHHPSPS
jgi:hypothetical protein